MSVFNPDTSPIINLDDTRHSRGREPNTAMADLFKDVGNTAVLGIKAKDAQLQQGITDDTYKAYDKVNDEFGVNAGVNQAQDAMGTSGHAAPQDLNDSLGQLKLLQEGYSRGDLKSYTYWGRMENEVKGLRAKYPGYRDIIDNTVSSITGATPANALRNGLIEEMTKNAAAGGKFTDKMDSQILENEKYLSPGTMSAYNQDPEAFRQQAMTEIQTAKATEQAHTANLQKLSEDAALGKNTAQGAIQAGQQQMDAQANSIFHDVGTALGKTTQGFIQMTKDAMKDGTIDQKEMAAMTQLGLQLKQDHMRMVNDVWAHVDENGHSLNDLSSADPAGRTASIKQANDDFNSIIDEGMSGNLGVLHFNQAQLDAQGQSDELNLLNRSGAARKVKELNTIGGPQWFGNLISTGDSKGQSIASSLVDAVSGGSFLDGMTSGDVQPVDKYVKNIQSLPKEEQAAAASQTLDFFMRTIIDPKAPVEQAKKAAHSMFDPENNGILTNFVAGEKNSNWLKLFGQLASPDVTKRMAELGKEDPSIWNNYKTWTFDKFGALFSSQAKNIQDYVDTSKGAMSFVYNPNSNEFNVGLDYSKTSDSFALGIAANTAQEDISDFNSYLKLIDPVMTQDKMDKEQTVKGLMESLGVKGLEYPAQGVDEKKQKDDTSPEKASFDIVPNVDTASLDLIRQEEGFISNAKYDVNAYRVGYGSDTVTLADGSVKSVTKDTTVTKDDAERDLLRRTQGFQDTAKKQIGSETWDSLSNNQKAALTSVTYNYGEVPRSVRKAAVSGDAQELADAISKLSSNPSRRQRESQIAMQ